MTNFERNFILNRHRVNIVNASKDGKKKVMVLLI